MHDRSRRKELDIERIKSEYYLRLADHKESANLHVGVGPFSDYKVFGRTRNHRRRFVQSGCTNISLVSRLTQRRPSLYSPEHEGTSREFGQRNRRPEPG